MDEATRDKVLAAANKLTFARSKPRKTPAAKGVAGPVVSHGLACHPDQVSEFNQALKAEGYTGIEYKPDGMCIVSSKKQGKKYMKDRGLYNRDAGYGEATPDNI